MTIYSVLPSGKKFTIIASWPGEAAESHSAKVTTVTHEAQAVALADVLSRISEDCWDALAWLDTYDVMAHAVEQLVTELRGFDPIPDRTLSADGCRHGKAWPFHDMTLLFDGQISYAFDTLSRTQRLAVADELINDATARTETLHTVRTGWDPTDRRSRGWQIADVGRATGNGITGWLPEGGAIWIVEGWGPDRSPAERWGARCWLSRIEQLQGACNAMGGRGSPEREIRPQGHLVLALDVLTGPHGGGRVSEIITSTEPDRLLGDEAVIYLELDDDRRNPYDRDPFTKVRVRFHAGRGPTETIATLDPSDDDGFAAALGEWTRVVPYRYPST